MNKARIAAGTSMIGLAAAAYLLGFTKLIGEVGTGTVTLYPAAAVGLIGALTLWTELRQV